MAISWYHATLPQASIENQFIKGQIDPGRGIDFGDPDQKLGTRSLLFKTEAEGDAVGDIDFANPMSQVWNYDTTFKESVSEEARFLAATASFDNFVASFSAAYSEVERGRASSSSTYFSFVTSARNVSGVEISQARLPEQLLSELDQEPDDKKRFRRLCDQVGTHYIESIEYMGAIVLRLSINSSNRSLLREFHADLNAFSFDASFINRCSSRFSKFGFTLESRIVASARPQDRGGRMIELPVGINSSNMTQLKETVEGIQNGSIELRPMASVVNIKSLYSWLDPWPNVQRLLHNEHRPTEPQALIPSGTVVAWRPTEQYLHPPREIREKQPDAEVSITAPVGWVVCDGQNGTPNLLDRFIRGTGKFNEIHFAGDQPSFGKVEHNHHGEVKPHPGDKDADNRAYEYPHNYALQELVNRLAPTNRFAKSPLTVSSWKHIHPLDIEPAKHDPPHSRFVYIMKV